MDNPEAAIPVPGLDGQANGWFRRSNRDLVMVRMHDHRVNR